MISIKKTVSKTVLISACLLPALAVADLKPEVLDCDPKKAARNAAMEAGVGVSGGCDAKKAGENAKDDMMDGVGDKVDDAKDKVDDAKDDVRDSTDLKDKHKDKIKNPLKD